MSKDNHPFNILVIEDNPGDATLIEEYLLLQMKSPILQFAKTFKSATEILLSNSQHFDVILLDLSLPDKNGKILIEEILRLPNLPCPVLILTGFADVEFSLNSIQLGISDYLIKDQLNDVVLYKSIIYSIERWKFSRQIEESEKKYSALFDLSPQPMWVYNIQTLRFLQINKAAINYYGYSKEEFLKMSLPDIAENKSIKKTVHDIKALHNSGSDKYYGTGKHKKKSGELIDIEFYSSAVIVDNIPCRSAIIIDITERKKTEKALKESEEKYQIAQRLGKIGNWELNLQTLQLTWSDETFSIFGIEKKSNQIKFSEFYERIHPDDRAAFDKAQADALSGIKKLDIKHRIITNNNQLCYVHELGEFIQSNEEENTHLLGTVQDVTEQVKYEIALRQSEARLTSIIESQSSYVIRTDLAGNYTYYNQTFFNEFAWIYEAENIIGKNGMTSIMDYDHASVMEVVQKCLFNPNSVFQVEIDKPGKNNIVRTTLWDFVCLTNEHNEPAEIQCVGIDITYWKKTEKSFIKTLEERNNILESIGDAFFAIDKNWTITYWNYEAEKISKASRDQMIGKNFIEAYPEIKSTAYLQYMQDAFDTFAPKNFETFSILYQLWFEVSIFPSEFGLSIYLKNISQRKNDEVAIANNEKKLQVLFNTVIDIIFMVSIIDKEKNQYKFTEMNIAGIKAMGVKREDVIGKYVHQIIPSPSLDIVLENYKKAIEQKETVTWLETTPYPSGIKTARVYVSPVFDKNEKCILLVGSIHDITEQLAYEKKLKSSAEELRALALHLQNIREAERMHIAREIHDELGQQLTGIKMDISWIKRKLSASEKTIHNKLEESIVMVDNTIKTVRKIATELRPSIIDDLGLSEAINWLSDEFTKRSGIAVKCNLKLHEEQYPPDISIAIFRIYQESLTNISRHANATMVICRLEEKNDMLSLIVIDNGVGFDQQIQGKKSTLGILGMKERVKQLNGEYVIQSMPGEGTQVSVTVPLLKNDK